MLFRSRNANQWVTSSLAGAWWVHNTRLQRQETRGGRSWFEGGEGNRRLDGANSIDISYVQRPDTEVITFSARADPLHHPPLGRSSARYSATYTIGFVPFKSKACESSITRLSDAANRVAMSRAASSLRSCRKPLFWRTASPMSSALRASPWARTIID